MDPDIDHISIGMLSLELYHRPPRSELCDVLESEENSGYISGAHSRTTRKQTMSTRVDMPTTTSRQVFQVYYEYIESPPCPYHHHLARSHHNFRRHHTFPHYDDAQDHTRSTWAMIRTRHKIRHKTSPIAYMQCGNEVFETTIQFPAPPTTDTSTEELQSQPRDRSLAFSRLDRMA
ncbi:hypothetical protein FRB95_000672 [Tulasnella sp. JGI-2019a]|nr:hypothetical protein FRB95_000672 [Tulasnella sp. JGI-2019a]